MTAYAASARRTFVNKTATGKKMASSLEIMASAVSIHFQKLLGYLIAQIIADSENTIDRSVDEQQAQVTASRPGLNKSRSTPAARPIQYPDCDGRAACTNTDSKKQQRAKSTMEKI